MIRFSSQRRTRPPSWSWWLLMCCGLCPCYRSSQYGTVEQASATAGSMYAGIELENMQDDEDEDFFEVGLSGEAEDDSHQLDASEQAAAQQWEGRERELADGGSGPDVVADIISAISKRQEIPGRVSSTSVKLPLIPLGSRGLSMLAQALFSHPTLRTLELLSNNVGATASLQEMSQFLTVTRSLTWLEISHNELSDASARHLAVGLRENASLRALFLNNNHLTDAGMQSLCTALAENRGLERLDVSGNLSIGDLTVEALLEAERKRRRRRKREEKEQERSAEFSSTAAAAAPSSSSSSSSSSNPQLTPQHSLTNVNLSSNSLSPHSASPLLELCLLNADSPSRALQLLDVSFCQLDDDACELIIDGVVDGCGWMRMLRLAGDGVGTKARKRVRLWRDAIARMEDGDERRREERRQIIVDVEQKEKAAGSSGGSQKANGERASDSGSKSSSKRHSEDKTGAVSAAAGEGGAGEAQPQRGGQPAAAPAPQSERQQEERRRSKEEAAQPPPETNGHEDGLQDLDSEAATAESDTAETTAGAAAPAATVSSPAAAAKQSEGVFSIDDDPPSDSETGG